MTDFIEKRHVVMIDGNGNTGHDYVPVEHVDAYVADAKTRGWAVVEVVGDSHDAGPAGDDGPTADLSYLYK